MQGANDGPAGSGAHEMVPAGARWCRVLDVTDGTIDGAWEHGHLESNLWDSEHRQRRGARLARHLEPGTDPNWRPQRPVRRSGMCRLNLERVEAIQIVAGPGGDPHLERDPNGQSGKAHHPAHSLGERQKPATYY